MLIRKNIQPSQINSCGKNYRFYYRTLLLPPYPPFTMELRILNRTFRCQVFDRSADFGLVCLGLVCSTILRDRAVHSHRYLVTACPSRWPKRGMVWGQTFRYSYGTSTSGRPTTNHPTSGSRQMIYPSLVSSHYMNCQSLTPVSFDVGSKEAHRVTCTMATPLGFYWMFLVVCFVSVCLNHSLSLSRYLLIRQL